MCGRVARGPPPRRAWPIGPGRPRVIEPERALQVPPRAAHCERPTWRVEPLTEADLRVRFKLWLERLGLDRWIVTLEVGGAEDETAYMETVRSSSYERGRIHVAPWVLGIGEVPNDVLVTNFDAEFVEAALVHELLHLHTRDMRAVVRDDLISQVHRDVYTQLEKAMERAEEQCVDRLALALVRAWPPCRHTPAGLG